METDPDEWNDYHTVPACKSFS